MSNRQRLARERLEIYLAHLILMYQRLVLVVGLGLLVFAIALISINQLAGYASAIPAIFLLLLGSSYHAIVYTARLGAWIGTLWRYDNE